MKKFIGINGNFLYLNKFDSRYFKEHFDIDVIESENQLDIYWDIIRILLFSRG